MKLSYGFQEKCQGPPGVGGNWPRIFDEPKLLPAVTVNATVNGTCKFNAASSTVNLTLDPTEAVQTMTAFIASTGIGDVPTGSTAYQTLFAVGSTLFLLTFLMVAPSTLPRACDEEADPADRDRAFFFPPLALFMVAVSLVVMAIILVRYG